MSVDRVRQTECVNYYPAQTADRAHCAGLVGNQDGTFLVRLRAKKNGGTYEGEYILTVVYKVFVSELHWWPLYASDRQ